MENIKKAGHVCAAKHCRNKQYLSKESFFRFPKDIGRARIWALACGREELLVNVDAMYKSYRLCGGHFENKMFLNDLRNRLQNNAVPTIFPSLEGGSGTLREHNYSLFIARGLESQTSTETHAAAIQEQALALPVQVDVSLKSNMGNKVLISPSSSTQTLQTLTAKLPRKTTLRRIIKDKRYIISALQKENNELKKRLKHLQENIANYVTLEQYQILTHKFCRNEDLANFVNVQVVQTQKHQKGRR